MRFAFSWLILCLSLVTQAQNLVGFEYFIDTDPGVGNGHYIALSTPVDSINQEISIPETDGLTPGFHFAGVRVQDESGKWSPYLYRSFKVEDTTLTSSLDTTEYLLVGLEYFIDKDPGVGKGKYVSFGTPKDSLAFALDIPETETLAPGFHFAGVRVLDASGKWSPYLFRSFKVEDTTLTSSLDTTEYLLVGLEYFIDKDPGVGKGKYVSFGTPKDSLAFALDIPETATLAPGFHFAGVRVLDASGKWSPYLFRSFKVEDTTLTSSLDTTEYLLVGLEYFIDNDPGIGKGNFVAFSTASDSLNFALDIPETATLAPGFHFAGVRVLDASGKWSPYLFRSFKVEDTTNSKLIDTNEYKIIGYEYFVGITDPGVGSATYKAFTIPSFNPYQEISVNSGSLPIGEHFVTVRVKDEKGHWSPNFTNTFEVCLSPPLSPLTAEGGTVCNGSGNLTYKASGSPTGEYVWYSQSSGGLPITANSTETYTRSLTKSEKIYVATKGSLCNSSRLEMQGIVLDKLDKPVGLNAIRCGEGTVVLSPSSGKPLGGSYRWYLSDTSNTPLFKGDDFLTPNISTSQSFYVESITKNGECKSDKRLGMVAVIRTCLDQEIVFPNIPNVIFGLDKPYKMLAFTQDLNGIPNNQIIKYEIVEGQNRVLIKNDSIFYRGIGVVRIRASVVIDTTYTYMEASFVEREFRIAADAAEVEIVANNPVCEKDRLQMSPTVIKDAKYYWQTPSGNVLNSRVFNIYVVAKEDTGRYKLTVITPEDTLISSILVEVKPAPKQVYLDTVKVSSCANTSYQLNGVGATYAKYDWYLDGSLLVSSIDSVFTPSQTGVYSLHAIDANNCSSTTAPIYVNLEPDTLPSITYNRATRSLQSSPGVKYQWYLNNYLIANGTKQDLNLYVNGYYKVEVVNGSNCTYFSRDLYVRDNSLNEFTRFNEFFENISLEDLNYDRVMVSPQPADHELMLSLKSFRKEQENNFELLDINGTVMKQGNLVYAGDEFYGQSIDVSTLSPGMYLLRFTNSNYVRPEKVIIE